MQTQLNAALAQVQELTHQLIISRTKPGDSYPSDRLQQSDGHFISADENFVITSFDGKAVRFP
jgi:hypothetical protein